MTTSLSLFKTVSAILACLLAFGCASNTEPVKPSNLTAGMAKKNIAKGQTNQAEVMEVFGPPDMVTHRDGLQIWTYDKVRYDMETSGGYLTVLLAGAGSSRTRSASTSTMLIIYFDERDVVKDYRLNVTRF